MQDVAPRNSSCRGYIYSIAAEASGDLDLAVVEWWRPSGSLVTQDFKSVRCNTKKSGWCESGERETCVIFVSTHARAAVETAVGVPDHGDYLSPDREEGTIMAIQFELNNNKVLVCCITP